MTAPITEAQWAEARRTATEVLPGLVNEVGLPKALISYQARTLAMLEDTACRVLFIEKSRRIGLTFGFASYAALRAGRAKSAGGMDVMYISYSQEMTREFIDACAMWARAFSNAALAVDEFLFDDSDKSGDRSIQAFRIRFASGFEILALSSAPRTLRGKQVMVRPKPPSARIVSHRNSSSLSVPSAWLCKFVSGASMKRFFMAGPWASGRGE